MFTGLTSASAGDRNRFPEVAAGDLVLNLTEDLAHLVFDGVRSGGLLFEGVQVGEQLQVDEIPEVIAREGGIVIELACLP